MTKSHSLSPSKSFPRVSERICTFFPQNVSVSVLFFAVFLSPYYALTRLDSLCLTSPQKLPYMEISFHFLFQPLFLSLNNSIFGHRVSSFLPSPLSNPRPSWQPFWGLNFHVFSRISLCPIRDLSMPFRPMTAHYALSPADSHTFSFPLAHSPPCFQREHTLLILPNFRQIP